jgi:hypothetical protein
MQIDELELPSIDEALAAAAGGGDGAGARVLFLVGRDLRVMPVRAGARPVLLRRGQEFVMPRLMEPSAGARGGMLGFDGAIDGHGDETRLPARVACTMPGELRYLQAGTRVLFPRTGIVGVVLDARLHAVHLRVVRGSVDGAELLTGDRIELPDLPVWAPALTLRDLATLAVAARRADVVVLRRCRCPADLDEVRKRLVVLGRPDVEIRVADGRSGGPDNPRAPDTPSSDGRGSSAMSRAAMRRTRSASIHVRPGTVVTGVAAGAARGRPGDSSPAAPSRRHRTRRGKR